MEYIRQWKASDGAIFADKTEAQRYEAEVQLGQYVGQGGDPRELIANADTVVELLKPFCTPKRRAPKGNGKVASKSAPKQPNNQPVA